MKIRALKFLRTRLNALSREILITFSLSCQESTSRKRTKLILPEDSIGKNLQFVTQVCLYFFKRTVLLQLYVCKY